MPLRRLAAVLVLALTGVAVFFFTSRGDEPQAQAAAVPAPSGADVHYAQMMIDHHEQAVRMSRALLAKSPSPVPERIRLIADFVAHDQQREIDETTAWLDAWGSPPVLAGPAHGMLTEDQLSSLDRAAAAESGDIFLRLMIEHHEGAITMSRSLLDGPPGNVYLHGLAKHVINEQTAEIGAMRALLRP